MLYKNKPKNINPWRIKNKPTFQDSINKYKSNSWDNFKSSKGKFNSSIFPMAWKNQRGFNVDKKVINIRKNAIYGLLKTITSRRKTKAINIRLPKPNNIFEKIISLIIFSLIIDILGVIFCKAYKLNPHSFTKKRYWNIRIPLLKSANILIS